MRAPGRRWTRYGRDDGVVKKVLLVVVALVLCGGIAMGVRAAMTGEPELEVIAVAPLAELVPLAETLVVDTTGMNTCPGFTTQAPRPPLSPPMAGEDGRTSLAAVMLDDSGAAVIIACEGRTADLGSPREYVDAFEHSDELDVLGTSVETRSAFPEVVRRDIAMSGHSLTDRYFEHDGWVYVVGFLSKPENTAALETTVETILLSWTWT